MKTFIKYLKYIVAGLLLSVTFSCSDDFLNNDVPLLENGKYAIYIIPEAGSMEIPINFPDAGNAEFSLSDIPHWLHISSTSGQFVNGVAFITCSASVNNEFAECGLYNVIITINVEGVGKYLIPVYYVNEGTPVIETSGDLSIRSEYSEWQALDIYNKGEGILIWEIIKYPEWLVVDNSSAKQVLFPEEATSISIAYNAEYPLKEIFSEKIEQLGKIVIVSNDKEQRQIEINVSYNSGSPSLVYYDNETIDFGDTETEKSISFSNQGNGILTWQIEDCPEWITVSRTQGVLFSYSSEDLKITCDRTELPEGANYAVIKLVSNDVRKPELYIMVKCRNRNVNSKNIIDISGTVSDAWFDKSTDQLYISTIQPNRLLVYDTKTKTTVHEITLPNAPTCFSVSTERREIAVGHEGRISFVDMEMNTVTKTLEVESIVFDIEWGDGDWCCYTPGITVQSCYLKWINAVSDEHYESIDNGYHLSGGSIIKKIPNQNYIIATRTQTSPSGIIVFDSQTGEFVNYFHESIGSFWFSADGTYLFDAYNNVFRTSTLPTHTEVSPVAQLKFSDIYIQCKWIDHNPATNSLWVVRNNYYYNEDYAVWQIETNDYTIVNTLHYADYYMTTIDGVYKAYPAEAHYVFANSDDSEVIVIKNVDNDYGNAWSMEYVTVKK
jgi:hypothetical protein